MLLKGWELSPSASIQLKGVLGRHATKGNSGIDVAHDRPDVFPAYLGHRGLEIPAIDRGPSGKATTQRVADIVVVN